MPELCSKCGCADLACAACGAALRGTVDVSHCHGCRGFTLNAASGRCICGHEFSPVRTIARAGARIVSPTNGSLALEQPARPALELIAEIRAALESERIDPDGVGPLKALRELEELLGTLKGLRGLQELLAREHPNRPPVK